MPTVLDPPTVKRPKPPVPISQPPLEWPLTPPQPYKWTRQGFYELYDQGYFQDQKVILIDGEILFKAQPNPWHNYSLIVTGKYLDSAFSTGHHLRNQMALGIESINDPGPDLAIVVGGPQDYMTSQATTAVIVVEVSDSSWQVDTKVKSHLYALANVAEYWVVDLVHRQLIVHRRPTADPEAPRGWKYAEVTILNPEESIAPLTASQTPILVSDLLPIIAIADTNSPQS